MYFWFSRSNCREALFQDRRFKRTWFSDRDCFFQEIVCQSERRGEIEYFTPLLKTTKRSGQMKRRGVSREFWPDRFEYDDQQDMYICPAGRPLNFLDSRTRPGSIEYRYRARLSHCKNCPLKAKCCPQTKSHGRSLVRTQRTELAMKFQERMSSERGRRIYARRGAIAEFPFALIKERMGMRRFRLRGLRKVKIEALWAALVLNMNIWTRNCWNPA